MVDITLSKVVGYVFGIASILVGLGLFVLGIFVGPWWILSGMLLSLAGVIALPFLRSALREVADINVTGGATVGIAIFLVTASMIGFAVGVLSIASESGPGADETTPARLTGAGSVTHEGLQVSVTDYKVVENATAVDTNSNQFVDPDGAALLVNMRVTHVGENEREFPHPAVGEVVGQYNGERVSSVTTYRNFSVREETYTKYGAVYQEQSASEAYQGTAVQGWIIFEVPPDPDLEDVTVTAVWGPNGNQRATWALE